MLFFVRIFAVYFILFYVESRLQDAEEKKICDTFSIQQILAVKATDGI